MEVEELENRRKRLVRRNMVILAVFLCGGLAILLWMMLRFPKRVGITRSGTNCSDDTRTCPQNWDLINQTCFFESEHEVTWVEGQKLCRKHHASLAKIFSQIEIESVKDYTINSTYWIGLRKHISDNSWRWIDGKYFNNWFNISGSGDCAFMNDDGISTSSCNDTRRYLCSRKSYCI
ncbi:C-type lectin domain family 2 member F-like [Cavia porcellus]|uniref:C-type lectin domain family 2 member F-like n=1 Tax=Cavia porcellus TaxID=10141 RepID=UPI002FE10791